MNFIAALLAYLVVHVTLKCIRKNPKERRKIPFKEKCQACMCTITIQGLKDFALRLDEKKYRNRYLNSFPYLFKKGCLLVNILQITYLPMDRNVEIIYTFLGKAAQHS